MDTTKGVVVPAGGGKHLDMGAPGRFAALKLVGPETNESIMLFRVLRGSDFVETLSKVSATIGGNRDNAPASGLAILLIRNDVRRWRCMVWTRGQD